MRNVLLASTVAFAMACNSEITGSVQVDGAPFAIAECRSGRAFGFSGVQFSDASGRRVRLEVVPDGTTVADVFAAGADRGDRLGVCGTLAIRNQNSRINNVVNVQGSATLACNAVGHQVNGSVTFRNCH